MAPSLLQSHPSASAMRLAWNALHAGQLQSRSFFRVRSLACFCYLCELPVDFTFDEFRAAFPGVVRMLSNGGLAVYTQACPPNLHFCT